MLWLVESSLRRGVGRGADVIKKTGSQGSSSLVRSSGYIGLSGTASLPLPPNDIKPKRLMKLCTLRPTLPTPKNAAIMPHSLPLCPSSAHPKMPPKNSTPLESSDPAKQQQRAAHQTHTASLTNTTGPNQHPNGEALRLSKPTDL